MIFRRRSALKITYTVASEGGADAEYSEYLTLPGIGYPRRSYGDLKGTADDMTWPQGSGFFFFPVMFSGNYLFTGGSGQFGIRSWSITAEPGHVPGVLSVASYKTTNTDPAAPDALNDYSLDVGSWDSGPLPVFEIADGDDFYSAPRIRFVPVNLTSLL